MHLQAADSEADREFAAATRDHRVCATHYSVLVLFRELGCRGCRIGASSVLCAFLRLLMTLAPVRAMDWRYYSCNGLLVLSSLDPALFHFLQKKTDIRFGRSEMCDEREYTQKAERRSTQDSRRMLAPNDEKSTSRHSFIMQGSSEHTADRGGLLARRCLNQ